jgi:hypothetical protein
MLFAVFDASVELLEHDANQPTPTRIVKKKWQVRATYDLRLGAADSTGIFWGWCPAKIARRTPQLLKFGLLMLD